jgi:hypothetical protein
VALPCSLRVLDALGQECVVADDGVQLACATGTKHDSCKLTPDCVLAAHDGAVVIRRQVTHCLFIKMIDAFAIICARFIQS